MQELIAASNIHAGHEVRPGDKLRRKYLHGRSVAVIAQDGDKWLVRLDELVEGRYANAGLGVQATQLEIGTGAE